MNIPHLYLKHPLRVLRKEMVQGGGGRAFLAPNEFPLSQIGSDTSKHKFKSEEGEQFIATCHVTHGLVMSHSCDLDNDPKNRLIALIRPLAKTIPPNDQENIRNNGNGNYWYLPPYEEHWGESYVDFRRMTSLHQIYLEQATRIASLTEQKLLEMEAAFFFFLTRREVDLDRLKDVSEQS